MQTLTIKCVIFDFDGVVLDSANIKTHAFRSLFSDYPDHMEAIYNYHIENQGISRYIKFRWIYEELLGQRYTEEAGRVLGQRFSDIVLEQVLQAPFISGSISLLEELKRKHIPAYIASGTPDEELQNIIHQRGLSSYFQAVYGSKISKADIIRLILNEQSLKPAEILFIGDANTDYEAASETGVNFLAVSSEPMIAYWAERSVIPITDLSPKNGLIGSIYTIS